MKLSVYTLQTDFYCVPEEQMKYMFCDKIYIFCFKEDTILKCLFPMQAALRLTLASGTFFRGESLSLLHVFKKSTKVSVT